jgi:hypothetical protein
MNEDIEFEAEDFDDFELLETQESITRTAILSKRDMVALLCMRSSEGGGAIWRIDPREEQPSVQIYDNPEAAEEWFTKSLRTSRKNGWNVVYDGLPLRG